MRSPSLPVSADPPPEVRAFATALREDPRSLNQDGRRVEWDDGPWPVKVYEGAVRLPLSSAEDGISGQLARLLSVSYAASRVKFDPAGGLPATPGDPRPERHGPRFVTRRPIASGGSMYPTEVYVLHTQRDAVYHYDPWRHELTDLCRPAPGVRLRAALGLGRSTALSPVVVLLASRFWKNVYKYGDFGYRLGAVDAGVGLGRLLLSAEGEFGSVDVRVDFADDVVGDCLGLDTAQESVYAIVGLGNPAAYGSRPVDDVSRAPQPPETLERSRTVRRSARFDAMHRAAMRDRDTVVERPFAVSMTSAPQALAHDAAAMLTRTSNGRLFNGERARASSLKAVVEHTTAALRALRATSRGRLGEGVEVYAAVHRVEAAAPGWYCGDTLVRQDTNCACVLHDALFARTVNIELAAFTVHIAGPLELRTGRDYREVQLAVGVAVDAATVSATAVGLGSHPFLGFDAPMIDAAYGLPVGVGVLAQVCVGGVRPDTAVEIAVRLR